MKSFKLFKNEIKLFSKSKLIILMLILNILITILGINSINNSNMMFLHNVKRTSLTIGLGTARYGALGGSLIFSILLVFILSKDSRKKSMGIINSTIEYSKLILIRVLTLIFYEVIFVVFSMIIVMVIQGLILKIPLDFSVYIYCYSIVLFPAILFSILITGGLYMLSGSMDITFLTITVLFFMSLLSPDYLLSWVQTSVAVFSDFAGIRPVGRFILYNRLLWIFISISVFLVGYLSRRRYERGIFASLKINIKTGGTVILAILCIVAISLVWVKEPYVQAQYTIVINDNDIDKDMYLKKIVSDVDINSKDESMKAYVSYCFENKGNLDYISFDTNKGLKINSIKVNGKDTNYKKIKGTSFIQIPILQNEDVNIEINYDGKIKNYGQNTSMVGYIGEDSVYLLENSQWIFRPLTGQKDLVEISGSITAPKDLTVVTPGKLIDVKSEDGKTRWKYGMKSFNTDIAIFAGRYSKSKFDVSGINVEFYYSPRHEEYVKNKKMGKHIKNIIKFYSNKFGPYYSDRIPLKIVETSIYKPGGHSSSNIITFAEYMINRDPEVEEYTFVHDIEIIAHEIAHQWWGSAVECVGEPPWSSEGMANYAAYKYIEGEFNKWISRSNLHSWQNAYERSNKGYYMRNPEKMKNLKASYRESLEMEKLNGRLYYEMPLKLLKGEEKLGEKKFLENMSKVYKKYSLKELTYHDFLKEMVLDKEMISIE